MHLIFRHLENKESYVRILFIVFSSGCLHSLDPYYQVSSLELTTSVLFFLNNKSQALKNSDQNFSSHHK